MHIDLSLDTADHRSAKDKDEEYSRRGQGEDEEEAKQKGKGHASSGRGSAGDDDHSIDDELGILQAEMERMKAENKILKEVIERTFKDYQELQAKLAGIQQQNHQQEQQVCLSLGGDQSSFQEQEPKKSSGEGKETKQLADDKELTLSLSLQTYANDGGGADDDDDDGQQVRDQLEAEEAEEKGKETSTPMSYWPPPELSQVASQSINPATRKTRVSVRARCQGPTMNDGCQWRKYGQKVAKGNPCPRAYYRCTVAPGCPVRKQVQRCQEDISILVTTYEGTHNHPLPVGATALASTATSAANFLLPNYEPNPSPYLSPYLGVHNPSFSSSMINSFSGVLAGAAQVGSSGQHQVIPSGVKYPWAMSSLSSNYSPQSFGGGNPWLSSKDERSTPENVAVAAAAAAAAAATISSYINKESGGGHKDGESSAYVSK